MPLDFLDDVGQWLFPPRQQVRSSQRQLLPNGEWGPQTDSAPPAPPWFASPASPAVMDPLAGLAGPQAPVQQTSPPNAQPGVPLPPMADLPALSTGASAVNLGTALANAPQSSTGSSNANIGTAMHNTFAGTPLEIVQGDQHAFTYPSGARVGFDRYGDINTPNPLRNVDQTAQNIMRQFQGNLGIPLDQANQMAAHQISGLYNGIIPAWMHNQLGTDDLRLRQNQAYGFNGIPGSIQNNAQQTAAQFSPGGIHLQTAQRIREILATRSDLAPEAITEIMNGLGISQPSNIQLPDFQGAGGGTNTNNDVPRPTVTTTPAVQAPLTPFQTRVRQLALQAMQNAFPQTQQRPGTAARHEFQAEPYGANTAGAYNQAITNYLAGFSDQELTQANLPDIMLGIQRLTQNTPIQNFYQSTIGAGDLRNLTAQQRQMLRLAQAHGHTLGGTQFGFPNPLMGAVNPSTLLSPPEGAAYFGTYPLQAAGTGFRIRQRIPSYAPVTP